MPLNTYSGLQAAIAGRMKRNNLTTEILDFIALAEDRIGKDLRTWRMETDETLSATSGISTIALPSRCRDIKILKIVGTYERDVLFLPRAAFYDLYGQQGASNIKTGPAQHYTLQSGNIVLGPTPDSTYSLVAVCMDAPAPLSVSAPSNTLLTNYSALYFNGALVEGFRHIEHEARMLKAEQAYQQALAAANKESRKLGMSGTPAGVRSVGRRRIV